MTSDPIDAILDKHPPPAWLRWSLWSWALDIPLAISLKERAIAWADEVGL